MDLTKLGVWVNSSHQPNPALAVEVERAGYGALWIGGVRGELFPQFDAILSATNRLVAATGIVNVWPYDSAVVAAAQKRLWAAYPERFLLGIGVGHPEMVDEYRTPYRALVDYLDALDAAGVPVEQRAVAALGPRVLRLSAERSLGAHPYLVTPQHTREARSIMGPDAFLAPEVTVLLESDPVKAREIARAVVGRYHRLSNYVSNWRRLGFSEDEVAEPASDRLIDALVAHGDEAAIVARVREHLDAGADHVCIQLLPSSVDQIEGYHRIATAFSA